MSYRVWMPLLASLALLLSACGDSQEEANVVPEESEAEQPSETLAAAPDTSSDDVPSPSQVEDDIERQASEPSNVQEDLSSTVSESISEPLQADEETLAADPGEALDEASAMPGETTRSDVDDVIAETERRFEEAQRQLEQQFQEIEQQSPELAPMENDPIEPSWERESSLPEGSSVEGGLEAKDVDALIEDTERQFEEAQQRLEEQFQALESERPTNNDSEAQEAESSSDDTLDTSS
ncbi:MAG: hypothetical protein VX299_06620 [Pseudomonadota bacterium]|nr:hypothetical protein [Pseudomonadota bacterium]